MPNCCIIPVAFAVLKLALNSPCRTSPAPCREHPSHLPFVGALTLPEGPSLHAIPADLHRAPPAGAVPGAVVKGPLASFVGTDFQPAPDPLLLRPHYGAEDATKRCGCSGRFGLEHGASVLIEADPQTHAPDRTVELAKVGRFEHFTVVGEEQGAYPLSQRERALEVPLIHASIIIEQLHAGKPAEHGVGAVEFVGSLFDVPGVHEPANQLKVAGRFVSLHNAHISSPTTVGTTAGERHYDCQAFGFSALRGCARLVLRDPSQL